MRQWIMSSAASVLLLSSFSLFADDRPDHFEGEASESLEMALNQFFETNARIADIFEQDDLSLVDLARVHELTYTLENALERIEQEYELLKVELEELHLASEGADVNGARQLAERYLDQAGRFQH